MLFPPLPPPTAPLNSDGWSEVIESYNIMLQQWHWKELHHDEPTEVEVKVRVSEGRAIIGLISSPTFPIQWEITTRGQTLEAICWKWNYFFALSNELIEPILPQRD